MDYVCVTGGAGFLGSHLVERLVADGERVVVVDDLSTGNVRNIAAVRDRIDLFHGPDCWPWFLSEPRDLKLIYHLAATVGVRTIMERRAYGIRNNLEATERVLEISRGRVPVVFSSSSECYGKSVAAPFKEDESDAVLGPSRIHRWRRSTSSTRRRRSSTSRRSTMTLSPASTLAPARS